MTSKRRYKTLATLALLAVIPLQTAAAAAQEPLFVLSDFTNLTDWNEQQAIGLRSALQESCVVYLKRSGDISDNPLFGRYQQWHSICDTLPRLDTAALTSFFENHLDVYQVAPAEKGLFTGYFTPLLHGSRQRSERYSVPLLKIPADLLPPKPTDPAPGPTDKNRPRHQLATKMEDGQRVPYDDRAGINHRAQQGEYDHDVLLWLDSRVDRFFLQIQGSGTVRLDTGEEIQVTISGRNGYPYFSIGRYLKRHNLLNKISMQSIRQWLNEHPDRLDEVLHANPSFIFFTELGKPGPIGAQGTRLIPEHSAAVDKDVIPLGTPLWLSTTLTSNDSPFTRAMVAQDVGAAIQGHARADIFFGAGEQAAARAGYQNAGGQLFIMVPKAD